MAPDPRSFYRLSKARRSGSSTNISVTTASSTESALCSSPGQVPAIGRTNTVVTSPSGECRSRRDSRHKLRAHLFGTNPESVRKDSSDEESEGRNGLVEAARGVRDRLSRTGTIVSQRPIASRSKSQRSLSQSQLFDLAEPSEQEHEDSDHVANQIRERAYFDQMVALNHVSSPVDEDMHVDSVASPIRRRSLFTPGIATRTPSDILCKPPSAERTLATEMQEYYFNPTLSESSPLSRLASLDLTDQRRSSPNPRTSTPSNLDYTELGGLKLGTLRITNGADSPIQRNQSPLIIPRKPLPTVCPSEDYFTASEGKHSDDEDALRSLSKDIRRQNRNSVELVNTRCQVDERNDQTGRVGRATNDMYMNMQRRGSPLKRGHKNIGHSSKEESVHEGCQIQSFETKPLELLCLRPMLSEYSKSMEEENSVTCFPKSTSDKTLDFNQESDPIGQPSKKGHKLFKAKSSKSISSQAPNRNWNALIDDAERRHSEAQFHQFESMIVDKSNASSNATDTESESLSSSNTSIHAEQPHEDEEKNALHLIPTKTDSGYSSNSSLGSLVTSTSSKDLINQKISNQSTTKSQDHSESYDNPQDRCFEPSEQENKLNTPTEKSTQTHPSSCIIQKVANESFALDSPTQCSSDVTMPTGTSTSSTTLASNKSRKLKKQRPLSQPSPPKLATIQANRDLSESHIPPIPNDVAARHAERLHNFPLLEHTFPSLHHTDLRDSTSSPDLVFVPIRFPSPTHAMDGDSTSTSSSLARSPERIRDVTRDRPNVRRSYTSFTFSKYHRRSSQNNVANECDAATTIADFGTVTESLGGSPYDVARSTQCSGTPLLSNDNLSHPHQMTIKSPRAKSMIGMDELDAVEFSRLRSQHRSRSSSRLGSAVHSNFEERSSRKWRPMSLDTGIPPMPDLPPTISPKLFSDRGGVPGKMPRPRSIAMDVPPLPALPSLEQVEQKEAEISRSTTEKCPQLRPPYNTKKASEARLPEAEIPKVTEAVQTPIPGIAQGWETHSQAWSQRRKSAGDGLLHRAQTLKDTDVANDHLSRMESLDVQPRVARPRSFIAQHPNQTLSVPSRPFHFPITSTSSLPTSHNGSVTSLRSSNDLQGHVQRLSGRFEGGLAFGYEAGFGIGGSAGTRSMKTGASRKSVDVSLGFGLDLSDVPIFVAPS